MDLNTSQKEAVTCDLSPTLVIAGPGSGKTHVIVNRIHYMIKTMHCEARNILVVTFSKLAAEEMKERFIRQYGETGVTFGTLHSVFYRILRRSDPQRYHIEQLLLEDKKKITIQNLMVQLEIEENEDFLEEFLKHIGLMKNQLIPLKDYSPVGIPQSTYVKLVNAYEMYKERHRLFDFDDMLVACYYLLKNDPHLLDNVRRQYQYILIDEFQDINRVQFEIIRTIVKGGTGLFVVGDDDQSIYQFRGAKPEFLLGFKDYFPNTKQIFLEVNYRSTKNILNCSLALIEGNKARFHKRLTTPNPKGILPEIIQCKDGVEEAKWIVQKIGKLKGEGVPLGEIAIIYRTNIQVRSVVESLLMANMPFCLRDGMVSLYDQWLTQDLLSYLHLADNINQPNLASRIMNKPKRYISKEAINIAAKSSDHIFMNLLGNENLSEWQKNYIQQLLFDLQQIKEKPLGEALQFIRKKVGYDNYVADYAAFRKVSPTNLLEVLDEIEDSAQGFDSYMEWEAFLLEMSQKVKEQASRKGRMQDLLTLTTMHGSKGLEFHTVFVLDVVEGSIPHQKSETIQELEEERRLLYVAMTRAKKELYLMVPKEKHNKAVAPSSFLAELQERRMTKYFKKDAIIYHKQLGKGKIVEVLEKHIIIVEFNKGQIRKIDSKYCASNGIITLEGEVDEK